MKNAWEEREKALENEYIHRHEQELLDQDTHPVPEVLRLQSSPYFGSEDISTERYTSREWHRKEVERLWKRVWQMACREEESEVRYAEAMREELVRTELGPSVTAISTSPDAFRPQPVQGGQPLGAGGRVAEKR